MKLDKIIFKKKQFYVCNQQYHKLNIHILNVHKGASTIF
jgi:hypothetical protein